MQHHIIIKECSTSEETSWFWHQLAAYFHRDIFPGEGMPDFEDYRHRMQSLHDRIENPIRYLLFLREGQRIGFCLTAIYDTEDCKQFILEFSVLPAFRGDGTGKACAAALLEWGRQHKAKFAELNADTPQRQRFWQTFGFIPNGRDQYGIPLMLLPPRERVPFTVEILTDPDELWNLESSFLDEIGEDPLDDGKKECLRSAVRERRIIFFVARRLHRPVGICSVSPYFSTFACGMAAAFDDFYVEPAFRSQGAARLLAAAAQDWCRSQHCCSLTVGCSDGDIGLYRALGFGTRLGTLLAAAL